MIILFGQKALDLLKRIESLEQRVAQASYASDAALDEAARSRNASERAKSASEEVLKVNKELVAAITKVVEETPALPFERAQSAFGRVSAIRHQLRLMEERSSQ